MTSDPKRAPPQELLRLAEEGARNIDRAGRARSALATAAADTHLRAGLGGHYGSPRRRVLIAVGLVGAALLAGVASGNLPLIWQIPAILTMIVGVFGAAFLEPVASAGRVAREADWLASRPFPLAGYFEALQRAPAAQMHLRVTLRFAGEAPPVALVQGLLGRADPAGAVEPAPGESLVLRSGPVSGRTGSTVNKVPVLRNHRLVPYVHRLVDDALAPLHASYPLAGVELTRVA